MQLLPAPFCQAAAKQCCCSPCHIRCLAARLFPGRDGTLFFQPSELHPLNDAVGVAPLTLADKVSSAKLTKLAGCAFGGCRRVLGDNVPLFSDRALVVILKVLDEVALPEFE